MAAAPEGWLAALGLGLAAGLIACSGGDDTEPPPEDPNIPLAELCQELAEADCARLAGCDALYSPFDEARCVQHQAALLCAPVQVALRAAVSAGSLDYFELAARDCRNAIGALGCDVGLVHDLLAPAACRSMVSAKGTEGDPCHLGFDCDDGLYCDNGAACPGRCAPLLGNNQPCTFGDRCEDNLYCDVTAMRCLARTDLGGTCALALSGNPCVDGTFCDRSNPSSPSCARSRGRNEGCTSSAECAGGASCHGNRCSAGLEGDSCVEAFHCDPELVCYRGDCRSPGVLDDACVVGSVPCGAGLTCTSTMSEERCRPRPAQGEACEDGSPCLLSPCGGSNLCGTPVEDGSACADAAQCLFGRDCVEGRCEVIPRDCRY